MDVTKEQLLVTIRQYCLECCGNSIKEVRACRSTRCRLHPYRVKDAEAARKKGAKCEQLSFEDMQGEGDTL